MSVVPFFVEKKQPSWLILQAASSEWAAPEASKKAPRFARTGR